MSDVECFGHLVVVVWFGGDSVFQRGWCMWSHFAYWHAWVTSLASISFPVPIAEVVSWLFECVYCFVDDVFTEVLCVELTVHSYAVLLSVHLDLVVYEVVTGALWPPFFFVLKLFLLGCGFVLCSFGASVRLVAVVPVCRLIPSCNLV